MVEDKRAFATDQILDPAEEQKPDPSAGRVDEHAQHLSSLDRAAVLFQDRVLFFLRRIRREACVGKNFLSLLFHQSVLAINMGSPKRGKAIWPFWVPF